MWSFASRPSTQQGVATMALLAFVGLALVGVEPLVAEVVTGSLVLASTVSFELVVFCFTMVWLSCFYCPLVPFIVFGELELVE